MEPKTDDAEALPELEPLLEGDEPTPEIEYADLLSSFEDEADLDDSNATELDAGIAFDDQDPTEIEALEPSLDVGELLGEAVDDERVSAEGDAVGPLGHDPGGDISEMDPGGFEDDQEGGTQVEEMIDEELPRLQVADDDEEEGAADDELPALSEADEEDPPPHAELMWAEVPLPKSVRPHCVVRLAGVRVVSAGSDVIRVEPDDSVETLANVVDGEVASLALDGDQRTVVFATRGGELYRLTPGGGGPERLVTWRSGGQLAGTKATTMALGGPTPSSRPALLLHVQVGGGTLLESTDHGTTWRRVDLGGPVLALSTGTPPMCVVESDDAPRLFRSEPTGGFRAATSEWLLDSEGLALANDGDVVAALEPGRGVHVSADGGATLRRASGTSQATAVTVGRLGGRPSAFAALFDPGSGRTSLAWIDAASAGARVVAELSPPSDDDEDDFTRVASLAWDAHTETLWAAGAFGLARFRRPPSA